MRFIDEFRNPALAGPLVEKIRRASAGPVSLMEFCGTHTVSVLRNGIRQLLPPGIHMLSGPGCPVCVTAATDLDKAISLAGMPGIIVATFGDMFKVPGSYGSLRSVRADGADVRVVYSARDSLEIAAANRGSPVVFVGVGFETTAPTVAACIQEARRRRLGNFSVLCLHKTCPPVMKAVLDLGETNLDGIICPGHVSAIIGSLPYSFIPRDYGIACVVSGFEPLDILQSVYMLVRQVEQGRPSVEIAYRRAVSPGGNVHALELMQSTFETCSANWRGIGAVPGSGLRIRPEYAEFDAEKLFTITEREAHEPAGCLCGAVLRGVKDPPECSLFACACTPEHPVGPCMVSSEGTCAAYFSYGEARCANESCSLTAAAGA